MADIDLWKRVLQENVDDALGIFSGSKNLEIRHVEFLKKYKQKKLIPVSLETRRARVWMEGSNFDLVCELAGYDSEFVSRCFQYVQKAITLEKKLYDELGKSEIRNGRI